WSPALRQGRGMCGNQQVHGTDRLTSLFQLVPDAAVMRGAGRAVVIEHFEGRQDLSNSDDLGVIVAAVVGAEFQFRYRNGRQSDHVTLRLCLPAARHQGQRLVAAGALPGRRLETTQHENDHVRVQDVRTPKSTTEYTEYTGQERK